MPKEESVHTVSKTGGPLGTGISKTTNADGSSHTTLFRSTPGDHASWNSDAQGNYVNDGGGHHNFGQKTKKHKWK